MMTLLPGSRQKLLTSMNTVYTLWLREMYRFRRSKSRIIGSLATPLFFLVILGTAFNSSFQMRGGSGQTDMAFLAPGIIGMSILFSSLTGGVSIIWDREFGFLKEILIAPVSRFFVALGKALGGVTTAMIQGTLIMLIAFALGVEYQSIPGMVASVGVMLLIGLGFIGLGIALASHIESHEGFQMIMTFITMPVLLLSGAFFRIGDLPSWMKTLVYLDPLTYGIMALRFTLIGDTEIPINICVAVLVLFAATTIGLGGFMFGKAKI
ncbi:MAG: ABC transporter permease [Methanosarcinales archaeon]|nr:ABC transporter permease [ANME-2 cluster archaeon]MDF1532520.1 ABC transporter permease [ANME-2 cluster archaeon]MDW7776876.1 ABC transporter permease [Methanosarcinales archaeon]